VATAVGGRREGFCKSLELYVDYSDNLELEDMLEAWVSKIKGIH